VSIRRRACQRPTRFDSLDDLQEMPIVTEYDVGLFQAPFAFDVNLIRPVDQDVWNRWILQKHFERTETKELVENVIDQTLPFEDGQGRRQRLAIEHVVDQRFDLGLGFATGYLRQPVEIQPIEQIVMDLALDRLVFRVARVQGGWRNRRRGANEGKAHSLRHALAQLSAPERKPGQHATAGLPLWLRNTREFGCERSEGTAESLILIERDRPPSVQCLDSDAVVTGQEGSGRADDLLDFGLPDVGMTVKPVDDESNARRSIAVSERLHHPGRIFQGTNLLVANDDQGGNCFQRIQHW
jgi:hypothetical protein